MRTSYLDTLVVLHRPKCSSGLGMEADLQQWLREHGLVIDTCLRQLAILPPGTRIPAACHWTGTELLRGTDAYAFMLQTVTGLHSAIPGETNVQGQFRSAWEHWRQNSGRTQVTSLAAVMHQLFVDSRAIRTMYLQGIGGQSYGSLVRKLLPADAEACILFVGAGALAQSMLPFFTATATGIWNRHALPAVDATRHRIFAPAAAEAAARWASVIILTTPADEHNDSLWADLADVRAKTVVHLGRRRAARGSWTEWAEGHGRFLDLDDIFELRGRQATRREFSIARARRACLQLAHAAPADLDHFSGQALAQQV